MVKSIKMNIIKYVLRKLGFNKPKFKPATAKDQQLLLISWLKGATSAIDKQLGKEIENNGFDLDKVRSGETILLVQAYDNDENEKSLQYSIGNVVIMRVDFKVNGFTIHARERGDARRVKKIITKGESQIISGAGGLITKQPVVQNASPEDIELHRKASLMEAEFNKQAEDHAERFLRKK